MPKSRSANRGIARRIAIGSARNLRDDSRGADGESDQASILAGENHSGRLRQWDAGGVTIRFSVITKETDRHDVSEIAFLPVQRHVAGCQS